MARYWRVSPKFWSDTIGWSEDGRTLALYLLTCPHRTTEGLFLCRREYIAADLGWPFERLSEPFRELVSEGFAEFDFARSLILIVKALKYMGPPNPNQIKGAISKLEELPWNSPLTCTFRELATELCPTLAEQLPTGFGNPSETLSKENEQAFEPSISVSISDSVSAAAASLRLTPAERSAVLDQAVELLLLRDGSIDKAQTKDEPSRWLAAARNGRRSDHHDRAHAFLADSPCSPEDLADLLEPTTQGRKPRPACPDCGLMKVERGHPGCTRILSEAS